MEIIPGVGLPVAGWAGPARRSSPRWDRPPARSTAASCGPGTRRRSPSLWSLLSLTAADIDTDAASVGVDDGEGDQLAVEGVAIAPAHYLAGR